MALVVVLAAGCGGGDDKSTSAGNSYPKDVVAQYTKSCEAQAKASSGASAKTVHAYCGCTIDYLQQHLSFDEFKQVDAAAAKLEQAPPHGKKVFEAAIKTCRDKVT